MDMVNKHLALLGKQVDNTGVGVGVVLNLAEPVEFDNPLFANYEMSVESTPEKDDKLQALFDAAYNKIN